MIKMTQKKQRRELETNEADTMENNLHAPESGEGKLGATVPQNSGEELGATTSEDSGEYAPGDMAGEQSTDTPEVTMSATVFTKRQLMESRKYASRRDLLSALLSYDKPYSTAEADELINKFMKGGI